MRRAIALLWLVVASQACAAFGYYSPISINAAQVPGTETDFPVLVLQTDNRFKTVANGGHVQDAQGDDIRPYTDTGLGTPITGYEKVFYDGTTGTIEMWVKVSSLTSSSTPFVLAYGDPSLTTDGSSSTTWSNSFSGVWHVKDGTTLSLTDSSGNARTLTNVNTVTAAVGQIDGAAGFLSASNQYFVVTSYANGIALTLSAWVKATTFPNAYNTVMAFTVTGKAVELLVKSTGKLTAFVSATTDRFYDGTGSHTLSTGTWYLLHVTYDSTAGLVAYVDAGSDGTVAANGNAVVTTNEFRIAEDAGTTGRRWNGTIDEPRVATVARSANWITTEYNNQVAPGTFETLGTEVPIAATGNTNFFMFFP